ncbi:MAG: hypothetical protein K2O84_04035 [Oscillospiraceae bacterium]|nr:hypothetical protein [Oscillospiraceae bacterium]
MLFLTDRTSLVTQAKRSFVNLLPDLSLTNLCEDRGNLTARAARAVSSTYQTMMGCIDDARYVQGGNRQKHLRHLRPSGGGATN